MIMVSYLTWVFLACRFLFFYHSKHFCFQCITYITADSCRDEIKSKASGRKDSKGGDDLISSLLNSIDDDLNMDMMLG